MAFLYDIGFYILLLHSMINITILVCFLFGAFFASMGLSFFNNNLVFVEIIFLSRPLSLGSPIGAFLFNKSVLSKSHLVNNFASYSNLSIYSLLIMTTYFVCKDQIQKCFDVLGLYLMRIPSQPFWWFDFTLFSFEILQKAKLLKIWIW